MTRVRFGQPKSDDRYERLKLGFTDWLLVPKQFVETKPAVCEDDGTDEADEVEEEKPESVDQFMAKVHSRLNCEHEKTTARRKSLKAKQIRLYDEDALDLLIKTLEKKGHSVSNENRQRKLLTDLHKSTSVREVRYSKNILTKLDELSRSLPHFVAVIDTLRYALITDRFTRHAIRLPPLLLCGAAGVGKSYFASKWVNCLTVPQLQVQMDSAQMNSTLVGADIHWSNGMEGELFRLLLNNRQANPVVVLDEIEKATGRHHYDPLAPLHGLLEPQNARTFADLFVGFPLDASYINWIATANTIDTLGDPLVSRFQVFHIELPPHSVMRKVVDDIFASVVKRLNLKLHIKAISDEAAELIAGDSPRKIRQAIEHGIGRALLQNRSTLIRQDVELAIKVKKLPIGFLSNT